MNKSQDSQVELSSTGGFSEGFRIIDTVEELSGKAAKRHFIRVKYISDDLPAVSKTPRETLPPIVNILAKKAQSLAR
jgi:hypothetical protein